MILDVVYYGEPTLRKKGAKIKEITPAVTRLIDDMVETMYDFEGVGLAAQQVGQALQLAVIDVSEIEDRPSTMEIDGKPVVVDAHMPMVLINPQVRPAGPPVSGSEGCLSFPEIYAPVVRPESVDVTALSRDGKPLKFRCGGLLARAVQHECDHLMGVLFIDRMAREEKEKLQEELDFLHTDTKKKLAKLKK